VEIKFDEHNDWIIVRLGGKLNIHSAQEFKFGIRNYLSSKKHILLDFKDVENIDSVGIGCLLYCQQEIHNYEGLLRISGLNEQIKIIFQVTRGYEIFEIYEDSEIAMGQRDIAA